MAQRMKTIKLSRDEEETLREVIRMAGKHLDMGEGQKHLESIQIQIERAPDDTVAFMELIDSKPAIEPEEEEEEEENEDLESCEQCGEHAWDGRICHACGLKHI